MAQVTEKMLEEGRKSRNLAAIPIWGTFVFVLSLLPLLAYLCSRFYQPFIEYFSSYQLDFTLTEGWGFSGTINDFFLRGGWPILGAPAALFGLILIAWMKSRKSRYSTLFALFTLSLIVAIIGEAFNRVFMHFFPDLFGTATGRVRNIALLVCMISELALFGTCVVIGVFSWIDHSIHSAKYAPIYKRYKTRCRQLRGAERRKFKKSFRHLWADRDYSAMVGLLYEDNMQIGSNSPMDQDSYRFVRESIIDSYGRAMGENLDYLYFSGQYDALRADQRAIQEALEAARRPATPVPPKTIRGVDAHGRPVEIPIITIGPNAPLPPGVAEGIEKGRKRQIREKGK